MDLMKVLVLGGTWFIGNALVRKLIETGKYEISILNRGTREKEVDNSIELIKANRLNREMVGRVLEKREFDIVFDISGYNSKDVETVILALSGRINHYIFCSSVAVCKQPPDYWPLTEDHPKCSSVKDNEYGFKKWQAETLLWKKWQSRELNVTVVRPVYVYGPYNYRRQEKLIFKKAFSKEPIFILGNGENIIQFGYVDDLAEAMILMASNSLTYGQAFNVSGYELVTVNRFINLAAKAIAKEIEIRYVDQHFKEEELAQFPDIHRFASISKVKNVLGIEPKTSLFTGLKKTAQWWFKEKRKEMIDCEKRK